jgi:hypothetical protein
MFINSPKIAVVLCWLAGWCVVVCLSYATTLEPQQEAQAGFEQNFFRQTRFGWQDCRSWRCQPRSFEETPVHPVIAAILLLFGSLGVFVWASEEDEIAEMFGSPPPVRRSSIPKVQRVEKVNSW